jgi:predicted metalloprotease with PDZ domain
MGVKGVATLQIIACLAVAAAGLVPVVQKNRPFWGLYCKYYTYGGPREPEVHEVCDDSPAHSAGLRLQDVILAANGSAVDGAGLTATLNELKPGETARLRVRRGEVEMDVPATGVEPLVAMIYYPTVWHPVAGGVGLALGLLVLATQPLRPAPR